MSQSNFPESSSHAQSGRRHIVLGILAHVDAGKTTLSESLLYLSGAIRRQGRVDHKDTYLDTDSMEKARGITIFSKQANLTLHSPAEDLPDGNLPGGNLQDADLLDVTLLDTPGHADFSPEMERTLSVLDYALLVISAPDGVTGQVTTLWKLLSAYQVPVLIFVNKMDQPGMSKDTVLQDLKKELSDHCVPMPDGSPENFGPETEEDLAVCDDALLEAYLDEGLMVSQDDIRSLITARKLFPVFFGSALKNENIDALAAGLVRYTGRAAFPEEFCARVFKISRDASGTRLAHVRVLGGVLQAKMEVAALTLSGGSSSAMDEPSAPSLKIDQIRLYSGTSFESLRQASAGQIVSIPGLPVKAGQILVLPQSTGKAEKLVQEAFPRRVGAGGDRSSSKGQLIMPVFRSAVLLEEGADPALALKNLRVLEEEEPLLSIRFDTHTRQITADIMGEVETEILRQMCQDRFGMKITFGPPSIVYRETIMGPVEGVGHYEPLRHYAEVHLLLEPSERGSGVTFESRVSSDLLAVNWQRLVLSSLASVKFRGVLTGSEITDMKVSLIGGRAHIKHTEGGDFMQASVRAMRQGLMSAENVLLEPYYTFEAEVPQDCIGRLMADIQRMDGQMNAPGGDGRRAVVTGTMPAAEVGDYAQTLRAYTHGKGQITFALKDYEPCRDPEKVILDKGYDPSSDLLQPADSVFCSHGAGVIVPWDQVREFMHVDTGWKKESGEDAGDDFGDHRYEPAGPSNEQNEQSSVTSLSGQGSVKAFSSDWRQKQTSIRQTFQEKQKEIDAGEEELKQIFERTYKGSSWRTPLHSDQNDYPDVNGSGSGVWSRDGSLERSMGLAPAAGQDGDTQQTVSPGQTPDGNKASGAGQVSGTKLVSGAGQTSGTGQTSGARVAAVHEDYLLVDGYNIIFAWEELRSLASVNLDSAAGKLIEILSDFQGTQRGTMIIVFDAYKVHGGKRRVTHHGHVDVIYTKEAETADSYIMELTHTLSRKGNVTVATGDGIVQMIIFSAGARRMSASELKDRVETARKEIREKYHTL